MIDCLNSNARFSTFIDRVFIQRKKKSCNLTRTTGITEVDGSVAHEGREGLWARSMQICWR